MWGKLQAIHSIEVLGYLYGMQLKLDQHWFKLRLGTDEVQNCYPLDTIKSSERDPGPVQIAAALGWRHNGRDGVSNHQLYQCLLNHLFRRKSKKTSKLRVTGLCSRNSPVTDEFPAQITSNAENVSIWRRHHGLCRWCYAHGVSKQGLAHHRVNVVHRRVYVLESTLRETLFLDYTKQLKVTTVACIRRSKQP